MLLEGSETQRALNYTLPKRFAVQSLAPHTPLFLLVDRNHAPDELDPILIGIRIDGSWVKHLYTAMVGRQRVLEALRFGDQFGSVHKS